MLQEVQQHLHLLNCHHCPNRPDHSKEPKPTKNEDNDNSRHSLIKPKNLANFNTETFQINK
jgi:hypothetical protein